MKFNNVVFAGNLTRDPEVRLLSNEKAVAKFTIVYNEKFKNAKGEQCEEATFVECEAWGRTAEIAGQYLTKGSECGVVGKLRQENWDDRETGKKRSKLVIRVEQLQLGSKRDGGDAGEPPIGRAAAEARPSPARPTPNAGSHEDPPF